MIIDIKDINTNLVGKDVTVQGWVKSNRDSGKIGFIHLFDGSSFDGIQIVYKDNEKLSSLNTGSALSVEGTIVISRGKQEFEIQAKKVKFANRAADDYPIQKKDTSLEFLRDKAHLRARTNYNAATMKIRSKLFFAIAKFYDESGFYRIHTPIITSNDCEGAGEAFYVTINKGEKSFENDFFKKKVILTVSGQLHAEAGTQALKKTYTFGPTFRSENSNTTRHAAEFWMLEPEIAFANLETITKHGQDLVVACINHILKTCRPELEFMQEKNNPNLISRLEKLAKSKFSYITYSNMVKELQKAIENGVVFEDMDIKEGMDFGSDHERYICEKVFDGPVFATHYPKTIKAFYMKEADNPEYVESFDLLVPGIGELIGGSVRENDYDKLVAKAKDVNIDIEDLKWYFDLRRFGSAQSAGFGLGFERLIMYVTGISNIRDSIPFPRTVGSIKF